MKPTEQIEQLWNGAISAHFYPSEENQPAAIMLGFVEPDKPRDGYILLLKHFSNRENTIVLNKTGNTLSLSIVYKATADTIKIDNLSYNPKDLNEFIRSEPNSKESKYMFMVAMLGQAQPVVISPYNPPQIYVADGYIITE